MTKKQNKSLLVPIIILVVYFIISLVILYFVGKTDFKLQEMYWHELMYPRKGAEYSALAAVVLMLIFVVLANLLLIKHLKPRGKIIANIIVIALFFSTLEGAVRWYNKNNPFDFRPHPYLIYERKTDRESNSLGIREEEIPFKKEKDEFRILVVGDSSTEGVGVSMDKRYSKVLEKNLEKSFKDRKIRVINGGIAGYTSFSIVRLYKSRLCKYDPDALVIAINNDCSRDSISSKDRAIPENLLPIFNVLYKSDFYLLLRKMVVTRKVKALDRQFEIDRRKNPDVGKYAVPPEDVRKNYSQLIDIFHKKGKDVIIVVMPRNYEHWRHSPQLKEYIKLKEEIAGEKGTKFVNMFEEWKNKYKEQNELFIDNLHPSEKGNKIIGDRLYELIMEQGLNGLNQKSQ